SFPTTTAPILECVEGRYSIPRPPDQRRRSCRCPTAQRGTRLSTRIQSRESLTRSGLLPRLMLHPAEKFHGSRATERLTTRLRPSRVGDVCSDTNRRSSPCRAVVNLFVQVFWPTFPKAPWTAQRLAAHVRPSRR